MYTAQACAAETSAGAARESERGDDTPSERNGAKGASMQTLSSSARAALDQQADSLISRVQPTSSSLSLRSAVYRFVEKGIIDCFHDYPVRFEHLHCLRFRGVRGQQVHSCKATSLVQLEKTRHAASAPPRASCSV